MLDHYSRLYFIQKTKERSLSCIPSKVQLSEIYHFFLRYVFVLRCIAYPFTVPLPQDPVRRYLKVTREYLSVLRERFTVRSV